MAMTKEEMAEAVRRRQAKKFPFTPEQYLDMKSDGMSDAKIMAKYELNGVKLNQWKHEHNLIRKDTTKSVEKPAAKWDDDTKSKLSELKDKLNAPKTAQEPQDESEERETTVSLPGEQKAVAIDFEKFCETKDREIAKLKEVGDRLLKENGKLTEKNAELAAENDRLFQAKQAEPELSIVTDLEIENKTLHERSRIANDQLETAQSEIHTLTEQVRQLERYKADYESLERLHAETRARLHAVEEENAALTGDETEHIQLMRRHVQLYDRMQGVYA